MKKPLVAIVIMNYNGKHLLPTFLPSIMATAYTNKEIWVGDDASTDESLQILEEQFPTVKVMAWNTNKGFAKGYNFILSQIEADYFALVNSDIEVTPTWLDILINEMEGDSSIGACMPKILSYKNKDCFEYAGGAGGWIDVWGYTFARGRLVHTCEKDIGQYQHSQNIFWASGACMIVSKKVFHQIGGFDEYLLAHMEEVDLCWRLQLKGYTIKVFPSSLVYHVGGSTIKIGFEKLFLNYRNNLIIIAKNENRYYNRWKIPIRLLLDGLNALIWGYKDNFFLIKVIWKAHKSFFKWKKEYYYLYRHQNNIPLKNLKGVFKGCLPFSYFVLRRKRFNQLKIKN